MEQPSRSEISNPTPPSVNADNAYEVSSNDLPLHCPLESMSLWDSHPRVYLPIEDTGKAKCPYCGAEYVLKK